MKTEISKYPNLNTEDLEVIENYDFNTEDFFNVAKFYENLRSV